MRIEPSPTTAEAAAIVAALEALWERESGDSTSCPRRLANRHLLRFSEVEPGMKLEGSLWSYLRWEGIA